MTDSNGGPLQKFLTGFWILAIWIAVFAPQFSSFLEPEQEIEIIFAVSSTEDDEVNVWGRAIRQTRGVPNANVLIVATSTDGDEYSPTDKGGGQTSAAKNGEFPAGGNGTTNALGEFGPRTVPISISDLAEILVRVSAASDAEPAELLEGRKLRAFGARQASNIARIPGSFVWTIMLVFVVSVAIALVRLHTAGALLKAQYYSVVGFVFLLSALMVFFFASGIQTLDSYTGREILSLGFATVFKASYVSGINSDWLFSLTSPKTIDAAGVPAAASLQIGFGAPLWVILLAVVGTAIYTISIVVKGIREEFDLGDPKAVRGRLGELILHQFYVLSSPLGAIFVYQLMVIGGLANQPVSVGLAALASGLALLKIFEMARTRVANLLAE